MRGVIVFDTADLRPRLPRMYACVDRFLASCDLTEDPCLNNGYTGKGCTCVCPRGTEGDDCGTVNVPYNGRIEAGGKSFG